MLAGFHRITNHVHGNAIPSALFLTEFLCPQD
jgi:hypothetical protein